MPVSWAGYEEALEALSDQLLCGCAVIVVRADGTVRRVPPADWFDKVFADGAQSARDKPRRYPMQEQIDRVETWANTLKAGQAPHQQQLADDALVLVNHAKGTLIQPGYEEGADQAKTDVGQAVATVPRDAFDALAQERDDLVEQLETARGTIETMYDEKAALEAQLADLTSQLDAATAPRPDRQQDPQADDAAKQDRA